MVSTNLMAASNQWASRPADQRFWSLADMFRQAKLWRDRSEEIDLPANFFRVTSDRNDFGGEVMLAARDVGRKIPVADSHTLRLSHFSFGRLCHSLHAPAEYLRTMPAPIAADCLEHSRAHGEGITDRTVLVTMPNGDGQDPLLRTMTSDKYERIWNVDVIRRASQLQERGWRVPPARVPWGGCEGIETRIATDSDVIDFPGANGSALAVKVGDEIAPSGLYASDHDCFLFMVNPDITMDDGHGNVLMRGFFLSNNEVGTGSIWLMAFWLSVVCGNHIVWGAHGVVSVKIAHRGRALDKWRDATRQLEAWSNRSLAPDLEFMRNAQKFSLGDNEDEVVDFAFKKAKVGATKQVLVEAYRTAKQQDAVHGDPNTAWGLANGMTQVSQRVTYGDSRSRIDKAAGALLVAAQ